jgi:hypothetical protein
MKGGELTTTVQEGEKRVMVSAFVDAEQRRFLAEHAREHDRSISAELRRAIRIYERETKGVGEQ